MSKHFTTSITILILLNTALLSLDRYPLSYQESVIYNDLSQIFSGCFLLEMIIKLFALGIKQYFKDYFNIFDCIIVISSVADIIATQIITDSSVGAITALRAFRLLRIFKLAKQWISFQNLLKTVGRTLKDVSTFSILLFLFIFIYALLGLELFAYKA